jgi:hypothetical protein
VSYCSHCVNSKWQMSIVIYIMLPMFCIQKGNNMSQKLRIIVQKQRNLDTCKLDTASSAAISRLSGYFCVHHTQSDSIINRQIVTRHMQNSNSELSPGLTLLHPSRRAVVKSPVPCKASWAEEKIYI